MADPNLPGRATTDEEKRAVVEGLLRLWGRMPEQRLGQLLANAVTDPGRLLRIEDAALVDAVAALVARTGERRRG